MVTIIPKVQIVNNIFFYILSITINFNIYSQSSFKGTFCIDYALKDFSNCLTFESEYDFQYEYTGDMGVIEYGKGEYHLIDNKLILNYNKTEPIKLGYHVSKIWTNNKDSININFNLFDFDKNPITSYVEIVFKDSLSKQGYKALIVNNKEGKASIFMKKEFDELEFEISSMEYSTMSSLYHAIYKLKIYKAFNHDISVFLPESKSGIPIVDQIDTLEIIKTKPKYFIVKNKNGSKTTWKKLDN